MFKKLVDSFLPKNIRDSTDDIRSERIFIIVLIISAFSDLAGINLAYEIQLTYIAYLLLINALIIFVLLFLYKQGLSKQVVVHIYIFQHVISFALQAWYQGGLISPAIASFFLLPAVTILILGKNSAIFWFSIIILIITGFFIYESMYGPPGIIYDESKKGALFFGGVMGTSIYIFIILMVYESSKNRAIRVANQKNQDLIAAQNQLIHAEKMASLGELTAGIAHEIQNPLNFVNNFSEINKELLAELIEAFKENNKEEVNALFDDLLHNEEKVMHHGKRAEEIVKSMLQHSRTGSGEKELTDINALADEYLRLAYHGFRAKDKSFNVEFGTEFDPNLPQVNVVRQDISRVFLNLINNAFQAVFAHAKRESEDYKPVVYVSTRKVNNAVEILISDNGPGIPDSIKDKIFQPFFTTKPTGQGTGLGLSLSYDIITKGHDGHLKMVTKEGQGTQFIVQIPSKTNASAK